LEVSFFFRIFAVLKNLKNKKTMKKLFLVFAAAGLLLASCSNDDNDNARRLPSQITMMSLNEFGEPDHWYIEFAYDDQNRLIRMVNRGEGGSFADTLHFFYETGNTPVRAEGTGGNRTMEFQHVGNQIIIQQSDDWEEWTTTLTLNANMQIVSSFGGTFEYDANGSLISIDWGNPDDGILTFTHTNIRSIFRYANIPNWMTSWMLGHEYPMLGYMPASISRNGTPVATMTHNLDGGSGFIRTRTITWHGEGFVETQTFDYINAR